MIVHVSVSTFLFFFNDTATTEIYTLSLHDALPISAAPSTTASAPNGGSAPLREDRISALPCRTRTGPGSASTSTPRSEEHTSELQSRQYLVCRLLLEKKKKKNIYT